MILDQLIHSVRYHVLGERFRTAFEFLNNNDLEAMPAGRYEIDGTNLFALVSEYETKAEADCKLEAHLRYADVQFMVRGSERMGYAPAGNQNIKLPYNEEKDIIFFEGEVSPVKVDQGMFAIFYPEDYHMPCMQTDKPAAVKKVVIKVRL